MHEKSDERPNDPAVGPSVSDVGQPVVKGERVTLRPPREAELASLATAIARDSEAGPWWGTDPARILGWLEDEEATVFVIEHEGEAAGIIMYEEETDPDYRFAGIDVTLFESFIGKGLGSDALRTLARYLYEERGHHRLHIDPAAANERAIRAYERVGFRPVGVLRKYERGPDGVWRDALLMDMLAEELH